MLYRSISAVEPQNPFDSRLSLRERNTRFSGSLQNPKRLNSSFRGAKGDNEASTIAQILLRFHFEWVSLDIDTAG
jgi:hypothetical protein